MYNGDAAQAMRQNHDIRYVLPTDGSIWFDNLAIPKDAPHRDAALAFMDYVLDADVGAEITRYFGYSTPNSAVPRRPLEGGSGDRRQQRNEPAARRAPRPPARRPDVGPRRAPQRFLDTWKEVSGE